MRYQSRIHNDRQLLYRRTSQEKRQKGKRRLKSNVQRKKLLRIKHLQSKPCSTPST